MPVSTANPSAPAGRHMAIGLSVLASFSTLTCCALPALFVSLGAGAALASLVSTLPFLVTLSEHKAEVFTMAILMLGLAAGLQWRARFAPCPTDPAAARWCMASRRIAWSVIALSAASTSIGAWFAFAAASFSA